MASRPLLVMLAVVGLLGAACASSREGYEAADRILDAVGADTVVARDVEVAVTGPSSSDAPCETEIREDEYGLPFEVCVGSAETQIAQRPVSAALQDLDRFAQLLAVVPDGPANDQLASFGRALDSMDEACATSVDAWITSVGEVTTQARLVADSIGEASELAGYLGQSSAVELSQVVVERAVLQSGCREPAGVDERVADDVLRAATARLSAAVESLFQALWGGRLASPYFYHPDELAHREWMRAEGSVDVVVAGTSQALLGIEPDLLEEFLGPSFGNVAIPGAIAEVQEQWLPQVVEAVNPAVVVWGIGPLDLLAVCPEDGRAGAFRQLQQVKDAAFATVPVAAYTEGVDLILGPLGASEFADTLTVADARLRFTGTRGDAFDFSVLDAAQLNASLEQFRAPFEVGTLCEERLPVIARVIEDLRSSGVRVIVFGIPVAPSLAALYAGGDDALDQLLADAAADVFEPAGAIWAGMMQSIDDDGFWYDVVHPSRDGGVALTSELAAALREAGL